MDHFAALSKIGYHRTTYKLVERRTSGPAPRPHVQLQRAWQAQTGTCPAYGRHLPVSANFGRSMYINSPQAPSAREVTQSDICYSRVGVGPLRPQGIADANARRATDHCQSRPTHRYHAAGPLRLSRARSRCHPQQPWRMARTPAFAARRQRPGMPHEQLVTSSLRASRGRLLGSAGRIPARQERR